jgi:predicted amidophosphoribosyltransferase
MRPLCLECRRRLRPGGSTLVGRTAVRFAFHHSGSGRVLVHRLKYHGLAGAAEVLAGAMAPLVPVGTGAIVPIPRAALRRVTYGVDPAWELSWRIARHTGIPAVRSLAGRLWWPRHALADRAARTVPTFRQQRPLPVPVVLVDDVITSGRTVEGAVAALPGHISSVVTATSPGMIEPSKAPTASGRLRDGTAG